MPANQNPTGDRAAVTLAADLPEAQRRVVDGLYARHPDLQVRGVSSLGEVLVVFVAITGKPVSLWISPDGYARRQAPNAASRRTANPEEDR